MFISDCLAGARPWFKCFILGQLSLRPPTVSIFYFWHIFVHLFISMRTFIKCNFNDLFTLDISTNKNKCKKIMVISGIGVREYYKNLGYVLEDTYMVKNLN